MRVNYLSNGEYPLDPSQQCLALRVPFILISYWQWGLRTIAFLGASMDFPNIPRSCIWLSCFLSPCSHSFHVESLFRFLLVKWPRDWSSGVVAFYWIAFMGRWIDSVGKSSGEKEISRLGRWLFARIRDMDLSEDIYIEETSTYM